MPWRGCESETCLCEPLVVARLSQGVEMQDKVQPIPIPRPILYFLSIPNPLPR